MVSLQDDLIKFWAMVDRDGPEVTINGKISQCWMWQGGNRNQSGYGNFWSLVDKKNYLAHKWIYEKCVGPVPHSLVLDHKCDRGPLGCVNYNHTFPTTIRANTLRGNSITAINAAKTHCIHGHLITGRRWFNGKEERFCKICRMEYIQSDEYKVKKKESDRLYSLDHKEEIAKYQREWREDKKKNDPEYMAQMKARKKLLEQQRMADPEYKAAYNLRKKLSRKPKNKKVV